MLAAAVGIDGAVEREVRRGVARDHAAAGIRRDLGPRRRIVRARQRKRIPAVVERIDIGALEAHLRVEGRASALAHDVAVELSWHARTVAAHSEHNKNVSHGRLRHRSPRAAHGRWLRPLPVALQVMAACAYIRRHEGVAY
jgi:hypothetical protein